MKIVYILVSDDMDFYWEQTYVSMMSLIYYNPYSEISLVIDKETMSNLIDRRSLLLKFTKEVKVVNLDNKLSKKIRSRILKTSLRNFITGDFLYLDCDTIILDRLPKIPVCCDIAAVHLYHFEHLSQSTNYYSVLCEMDVCGEKADREDFFNGGVIYAKDTPMAHKFFDKWNYLYSKFLERFNIEADQPSLYVANNKMNGIIKALPAAWNYQVGYGLNHLSSAIILHYLISTCKTGKSPIHVFQQSETMAAIRNHINEKDYLLSLIKNARLNFLPYVRATAERFEWTLLMNRIIDFAKNKRIYLYGPDANNKMAHFVFKQAKIKIVDTLVDNKDIGKTNDKSKIGVIILGPQGIIYDFIPKLAHDGFLHFLPIATDR